RRERQALDRPDDPALDLADRHEAGIDDLAVEDHRAGPALPFPAALLRASEAEILAQDVEQPAHPGHVDLRGGAVDEEPERGHAAAPFAPEPAPPAPCKAARILSGVAGSS